ncbi:MAG: TRAM domain-containing protein, partial [Arthrobacter sp.]
MTSRTPTATQPQTGEAGHTGEEAVLDVGPVAHGGHCVARHEGRVVFVRHAIPGEKVRARLTDAGDGAKFWRADVVEVLEASPDRVEHFWRPADSLRAWSHGHPPVGGAEFGHITLARQRSLKADVLAEQLTRLAGFEQMPSVWAGGVEA